MVCYSPLTGWRPRPPATQMVFTARLAAQPDAPQRIDCGQCIGCRLSHSLDWAARCMHEVQMHPASCFITLTYSKDFLPLDGGLVRDEVPLFMKRLRKRFSSGSLSVFYCGEYGDLRFRPHYHAILFGTDFAFDRKHYKKCSSGDLYTSPTLDAAWGLGHAVIGEATFESAAYCARYSLKKVTGLAYKENGFRRHTVIDTGECRELERPFAFSSNRPAIGKRWFDRYWSDVYPHDEVIMRGFPRSPPRYYDDLLQEQNPFLYDDVKERRLLNMTRNWSRDRHSETALYRQFLVKNETVKLLSRSLDQ